MRSFLQGMFSQNGAPSSSRVLMFLLGLSSIAWISLIVWRTSMLPPALELGALAALVVAPYTVNACGAVLKARNGVAAPGPEAK